MQNRCPENPHKGHYPDKIVAQQSAVIVERQAGVKLRAYKCLACPYWHLTSKEAA